MRHAVYFAAQQNHFVNSAPYGSTGLADFFRPQIFSFGWQGYSTEHSTGARLYLEKPIVNLSYANPVGTDTPDFHCI